MTNFNRSLNKNPGIKIPFLPAPETFPTGVRCLTIIIPDADEYELLLSSVMSVLEQWYSYRRDDNESGRKAAKLWRLARDMTETFGDCMNCEDLLACITPLYQDLVIRLQQIDAGVQSSNTVANAIYQEIQNLQAGQKPTAPKPYIVPDCDPAFIYAGCIGAVEYINETILDVYEVAAASVPQDAREFMGFIISAIPVFETLPVDEIFEVAGWYYANQQQDYEAAYTQQWKLDAACQLWCLLQNEPLCQLTHEVLGEWLINLRSQFPENAAADIYTRFGEATVPTFQNQLASGYNTLVGGQSLANWFNAIILNYGVAAQDGNPLYVGCTNCPVEWDTAYDFCDPELDGLGVEIPSTLAGYIRWQVGEIDSEFPGGCIRKSDDSVFTIYSGMGRSPAFAFNWEFWWKDASGVCHSGFPVVPQGGLQVKALGGKPLVPNANGSWFEFKAIP